MRFFHELNTEKLKVTQLLKKLPAFYGTWMFLPWSQEPPLVPILSQMNSVHASPPILPKLQSNVILPSTSVSSE
jgi:hypothetical protein